MSTEARESVEDIISALLEEAAVAIRWAQQYEVSKRQGLATRWRSTRHGPRLLSKPSST